MLSHACYSFNDIVGQKDDHVVCNQRLLDRFSPMLDNSKFNNDSELNMPDLVSIDGEKLNEDSNYDEFVTNNWEMFMKQDTIESIDVESLSGDSSDESDISEEIEPDIENKEKELSFDLGMWAASFSITMVAVSSLLDILRVLHPSLPKDPRTLLKTPRTSTVKTIEGGSYFHFGIVKSLQHINLLPHFFTSSETLSISLQINIDGLPLQKSSTQQFWPILGRVSIPFSSNPFLIGLFCGQSKPVNLNEYLKDFIEEMLELEKGPVKIDVDGKKYSVNIGISCFVCDTPARAYIKQSKGHTGYYSCDKCIQKGEWHSKVTFLKTDAPLRTDHSFNDMIDANHHIGDTPLKKLSIGMVTQFPLDFMHLVCLGVMKRILMFLIKSPVSDGIRLGMASINGISERLVEFKSFIPCEFSRQCRPLSDIERWKAVEFSQFLLYSGIVALKGNLSKSVYNNFLLFFVAIHCLASSDLNQSHADYAESSLKAFVKNAIKIYGRGFISYNVHSLIHIASDVKRFGSVYNYSAFPFENFLGHLKRLIRKPHLPLQQVIRRIFERNGSIIRNSYKCMKEGIPRKLHEYGPIVFREQTECLQYQEITLNGIFYSTSTGNNCIKIKNDFVLIRNILKFHSDNRHFIVYEKFLTIEPFFRYPANSLECFDIAKVSKLSCQCKSATTDKIQKKYVILPYKSKFVCIPLSTKHQIHK